MSEFECLRLDQYLLDGDIVLGRGNIISKEDIEKDPGNYPIYSSSAQGDGKFGEYNQYMFDEELITWSVDGGGTFFYRPKHKFSVTNVSGFMRVNKQKFHPRFIYYVLANQHINLTFDYTTKAHPSVIKQLYWLPKISEGLQAKIATILASVDNSIEKTKALIAKYENIKQGMMQDLFSRGVDENGKLRPSYEDAPHLYQETALGWIPKDWTVKTVGQVFEIQLGKMLSQKSKSGKFEAYYLGNKNVQWGYFDLSKVETMDFQSSERQKFILKKGDILVTEGGEVGRTAIWNNELGECYYQKALHRLRPNSTEVVPEYFSHFMFLSNLTGAFTDFTSQTSIAHLTQEKLSKFPIKLPPKNEQLMLAKVLGRHDDLISLDNEKLAKLKKIKAGLMQDLLTGKVRVAEDMDERKEAVA